MGSIEEALSALTGLPYYPKEEVVARGAKVVNINTELLPHLVWHSNYNGRMGSVSHSATYDNQIGLFIDTARGRHLNLYISGSTRVGELQQALVQENECGPSDYLTLHGLALQKQNALLTDYGIRSPTKIQIMSHMKEGLNTDLKDQVVCFSDDSLAPQYDYDFTYKTAQPGENYIRGGRKYEIPYGWKRYAFNALGKYDHDTWLGENGIRQCSTAGEWMVTYHGTSNINASCIVHDGRFNPGDGMYGHGIYSTNDPDEAESYAILRTINGANYRYIIQNRVNPYTMGMEEGTKEVKPLFSRTGQESVMYYVTKNNNDIRMYGLLEKKL